VNLELSFVKQPQLTTPYRDCCHNISISYITQWIQRLQLRR